MHLYDTLLRLVFYCLFPNICSLNFAVSSFYHMLSLSWQDPVKYPDNMSANFKNFLKGLLNKVLTDFFPTMHSYLIY
jgi:hypothetical protein